MTDLINPSDWALVVCVSANGIAQVYGRRTARAAAALRMVADGVEHYPSLPGADAEMTQHGRRGDL